MVTLNLDFLIASFANAFGFAIFSCVHICVDSLQYIVYSSGRYVIGRD
jgi:hypothetical protein